MYKNAIFYTKLGLNLWNMTLNIKDESFYTKIRNFIIPLKLLILLKYFAFSLKVLKAIDFWYEVMFFYKFINKVAKRAMKQSKS